MSQKENQLPLVGVVKYKCTVQSFCNKIEIINQQSTEKSVDRLHLKKFINTKTKMLLKEILIFYLREIKISFDK